jgi:hypothetical protein
MEHFYYKTDAVYGAMRKLAVQQQQAAGAVQARCCKFLTRHFKKKTACARMRRAPCAAEKV